MATTGEYPIDPSTLVGQLRLAIDDTTVVENNGDGTAEYGYLGDESLRVYLRMSHDDVGLARAYAYQQIAAVLILRSRDITSDDLKIQMTLRAEQFRRLANDILNGARESAAVKDIFETAGGSDSFDLIHEGVPGRWGRIGKEILGGPPRPTEVGYGTGGYGV